MVKSAGSGHEVADLAQERLVAARVGADRAVGLVPVVDLVLHLVAQRQQRAVLRRELAHQPGKAVPELLRRETPVPGMASLLDEIHQQLIDLQAGFFDVRQLPMCKSLCTSVDEPRLQHGATSTMFAWSSSPATRVRIRVAPL